jgi:hypothetical protein
MEQIKSLYDVRPGDMYIGNISGAVGIGVALGEIVIGDGFRIGQLSVRHVGIVTEAAGRKNAGTEAPIIPSPVMLPRMAQAMPGGAEVIALTPGRHWTPKSAFIRLPEDYPGQALDAAAVAVAMVDAGVAYSPLSYAAIALAWRGIDPPSLLKWIDRRREPVWVEDEPGHVREPVECAFPVEAICSVFADQAWTLVGKQVMPEGTPAQLVTPGGLARQWFRAPGTVCGGAGLLESV